MPVIIHVTWVSGWPPADTVFYTGLGRTQLSMCKDMLCNPVLMYNPINTDVRL